MKILLKKEKGKEKKILVITTKLYHINSQKIYIMKKKTHDFFMKIIMYFELYILKKHKFLVILKKIIISHFFHIPKRSLIFRIFYFGNFNINFLWLLISDFLIV